MRVLGAEGLKDGAGNDAFATGGGSALPRPPWVKRIASDWRNVTSASGAATAASLRLIPFTSQGLEITAVDFHVQGSITSGTTVFLAIYAADEITGLPAEKLWDNAAGQLITAAGAVSVAVSGLSSPPKSVWVATYISAGSTTQFVTGAVTGDAEREFGIPTGMALNAQIVALLASNAWSGAMPATISWNATTPFTTSGNVINSLLRMAAPA